MTNTPPVVDYDTGGRALKCPLCRTRPIAKKTYGHDVCKKCYYAFANRRQIGYLIDAVLITIINLAIGVGAGMVLGALHIVDPASTIAIFALSAVLMAIFICKDGFGGYSIGKYLMGVQVLDNRTGQPAGFVQSFKRNAFLLFGLIPFAGGLISLILVLVVAYQDASGFRMGDSFAGTRVIWKKYAHLPIFGGNALVCETCGYDLRGNISGTCPECGTAVSERNRGLLALPDGGVSPVSVQP